MKVIITENQLKKLFINEGIADTFNSNKVFDALKSTIGSIFTGKNKETTTGEIPKGTSGEPVKLDLTKSDDFSKYEQICDKFISKYKNPLQITGTMLANGAKKAYMKTGNYVPPELALSQLLIEGGLTASEKSRPIRTKNPFNVGNVDAGGNIFHNNVQSGIDAYYDLISRKYLTGGKKVSDLINKFTNIRGNRYASDSNYETKLEKFSKQVQGISNQIIGFDTQNLA